MSDEEYDSECEDDNECDVKPCPHHCDLFKHKPYVDDEEDRQYLTGEHYFKCVYCIMETGNIDEEWDSWNEVTGRSMSLIYIGYCDYISGITNFLDTCKPIKNNNNIIAFRNYYRLGQQLASKGVDCGYELWDVFENRSIGIQYYGPITTRNVTKEFVTRRKMKPQLSDAPHILTLNNMKLNAGKK